MTTDADSIESILALRGLTRKIADIQREVMTTYLATLSPLLRPRLVFGEHVQGATRDSAKNADAALKDLTALHERISASKPFSLRTPLLLPLRLSSTSLEITPLEYQHIVVRDDAERSIVVRTPLKWIVSYAGHSPVRLRELLASRQRQADELNDVLTSYLVLHVVLAQQGPVADILRALHFPTSTERLDEFGDLPITCIGSSISTRRPSDDILLRSAELSGMDAFEEVVRVEDVAGLQDPLRDRLLAVINAHGSASR